MRKKLGILLIGGLVLLTGCLPNVQQTEEEVIIVEETEGEEEIEYVFTPTINTPEGFYANVLREGTYLRSTSRGSTAHAMNNLIDLDQFEIGLMEIASGIFSTEDHYFQEGQNFTGDEINSWIRRYDEEDNPQGLNPALGEGDSLDERMRAAPLVLSHVMEHNYYTGTEEDGVNLEGIVIGLSLRSVYYFRTETEDGLYNFFEEPVDPEAAEEAGKEMAQTILERIRQKEGLEEVPVTFALFQEGQRGAITPGAFISMTEAGANASEIGDWEALNESYIIFPSSNARQVHPALSETVTEFREDIENFFDRTVGVVGKGRFQNDNLEELKIEINLQSHGQAEIVALTQFVSGALETSFTDNVPIYVYIDSIDGMESLIVSYPDSETFVHIYK